MKKDLKLKKSWNHRKVKTEKMLKLKQLFENEKNKIWNWRKELKLKKGWKMKKRNIYLMALIYLHI